MGVVAKGGVMTIYSCHVYIEGNFQNHKLKDADISTNEEKSIDLRLNIEAFNLEGLDNDSYVGADCPIKIFKKLNDNAHKTRGRVFFKDGENDVGDLVTQSDLKWEPTEFNFQSVYGLLAIGSFQPGSGFDLPPSFRIIFVSYSSCFDTNCKLGNQSENKKRFTLA
ncbi:hypothetical protein E3N88_09122 [Mikania micrantha]|uniref:Uncharacterized protein n=1 Tax=Mikania micrantha TaxID=192012 RepID=A0A5N6PKE7_9ASTR|nr:hypothetical protein E3N88_09122 [Mikania micrantha]